MTADNGQPVDDQVTLSGDDAAIYEAIATLEFIGRAPTISSIAAAMNRESAVVEQALGSLTDRGMLIRTRGKDEETYEPAWRGWSTAPDQAAGPQL